MYNPQTVDLLQKATRNNDYETFKKYSRAANNLTNNAATLRSLLEFKTTDQPFLLREVEPARKYFETFAVVQCLGSISYEAHSTCF